MKISLRIVLFFFLCAGQFAFSIQVQAQDFQKEALDLVFDRTSGELSIHATQTKLSTLISKLKQLYGIDLFIGDLNPEETINCKVDGQFLDQALRKAIPATYQFSYKLNIEREYASPEVQGNMQAAQMKPIPLNKAISPNKQADPKRIQATYSSTDSFKQKPDSVRLPSKAGKDLRVMPKGDQIQEERGGNSLQVSKESTKIRQQIDPNNYYGKMLIKVTPQGMEAISMNRVEGKMPITETLEGNVLYRVTIANKLAYSNSFQNPLEQRSLSNDGRGHNFLQVEEAFINVNVPSDLLDNSKIDSSTVEFFTVPAQILVPDLKLTSFSIQDSGFQRIGTVSPADLRRIREKK